MSTTLQAPIGFCPRKGCTTRSRGLCADHQKDHRKDSDSRRGSRHQRGYGTTWDHLSAQWKADHPICGMRADKKLHLDHSACARHGLMNAGAIDNPLHTDHIVRREDGGSDDQSNLQTLCQRCHSTKTATEKGQFGR